MSEALDAKVKRKELDNKFDISNLVKNFDLKKKHATKSRVKISNKTELKLERDRTVKLQFHDLSFLFGKNLFSWWWFSKYICLSTKSW